MASNVSRLKTKMVTLRFGDKVMRVPQWNYSMAMLSEIIHSKPLDIVAAHRGRCIAAAAGIDERIMRAVHASQ